MKEEPHFPPIDPELEARIVALVLGEASDFERDELNRLIEEQPELAAFREEIQSVHGLLRDVATGESVAVGDDWKLPTEKRNAVLAVISGEARQQPAIQLASKSADQRRSKQRSLLENIAKIAAVLLVVTTLVGGMMLPAIHSAREVAATSKGLTRDSIDAWESFAGEASAPGAVVVMSDGAVAMSTDGELLPPADAKAIAESDYENDLKSSLSGIRESLRSNSTLPSPHHLADDLQSLPASPEFNLRQEATTSVEPRAVKTLDRAPTPGVSGSGTGLLPPRADGIAVIPLRVENGKDALKDALARRELFGVNPGLGDDESDSVPDMEGFTETGMGDRAESEAEPESPPELAMRDLGSEESGQAQESPLREGVNRGYRLRDMRAAGKGIGADDDDDGLVEGRGPFGGGEFKKEISAPQEQGEISAPQELGEIARRDLGNWRWSDEDTVLRGGQKSGEGESSGQKIPVPMMGTVIGRPRGQSQVGQPNQQWFWGNDESMTRAPVSKAPAPAGLNEQTAEDEAFSTFSLHVSDVSFKLARAALAGGSWPEAAKVRIEEFVNAFDYGDPMPSQSEKVACRAEQSVHPFLQQRNLLRVSMRTAAAGRSSNTPLRLTFLLDNSGSMERIDRQQTVRRAFSLLAQQLKPIDQVTLISFARQPRLLADKVSGAQADQLVGLIEDLPSEGGTNIEAALKLAFEKALEQQDENAQNRIILLTDGAVNLGDANPESLSRMITTIRNAGIAFDAAGISADGLNDEVLEALTRKGDGRYYLLDSLEAADDGFASQIAGALRPSAKNVKVQIEFNPKRVGRYKLLGFEKHLLKQQDFRNDEVDAAEMAAAEAGVALYQFEVKPDGEGDVGSVSVRFRDLSTGQMIENCWPIPYQPDAIRLDQAAPSLRIATSAAMLAAKLRGDALGDTVDLKTLSSLIAGLPDRDRNIERVQQLQQMIEQARQMSGK